MKNALRKSLAILTLMAAFAMIIIGCNKSGSASTSTNNGGDNGGGNGGGITPPPTGNYGTITLGNQIYTIAFGICSEEYDEETQTSMFEIALADGASQTANVFGLGFINLSTMPTGTFDFAIGDNLGENQCMGNFILGGNPQNALFCTSGNVTITKVGSNYKIQSTGVASNMANTHMEFSVNFEGPITPVDK